MKTSVIAPLLIVLPTHRSLGFTNPCPKRITSLSRLHVLFPNKRGIIVQADGDFVAKDPLLDDFMGRRSSARDVLRNDSTPSSPSSFGVRRNSLRGEHSNSQASDTSIVNNASATDPKNMKIRDIQKELQQRNVYFGDCFDRESLVKRLREARGENDDIASPENGWGKNEQNPAQSDQDASFPYNDIRGNINGWKRNDPNSLYAHQETAYGYKETSDDIASQINQQSRFASSSPYEKSERWVYTSPVPPSTPPPGYYNR
ncbi:hypothetical protein HJC23_008573 [Cyclotella cryptica]|uniref:Uncharacterized protein n=1 Tax=Cyclotella cryptica TaxID=29204 RepID=A0ABD3Q731_9STRA